MIAQRRREIELMDQPDIHPNMHIAALHGLRRINSITRSGAILWPSIARAAKKLHRTPLRVLDLACGGGDNVLEIARIARRRGVPLEVHGCDISPLAIAESQRSATSLGFDPNAFFRCDVLQEPIPAGYHVVTCSLFLHHLDHSQAVGLIYRLANTAERLVLISDLRRTWLGLAMAWIGSRLLTRSPVVHIDSVRSVAAAFTVSEIESLAECGLTRWTITRHWPQRLLFRLETF